MHKSLDMGKLVHIELDIKTDYRSSSFLHKCYQYVFNGLPLFVGGLGGLVIIGVWLLLVPLALILFICEFVKCCFCYFF